MKCLRYIGIIPIATLLCQGCASNFVYNDSKNKYQLKEAYQTARVSVRDSDSLEPIVNWDDEMIGYSYRSDGKDDAWMRDGMSTGVDQTTPWTIIFQQPIKQAVAAIWDSLCVWGAKQLIDKLDKE